MKKKGLFSYRLLLSLLFLQARMMLAQVDPQPGENIWHVAASIGTELDTLTQTIQADFAGTFTAIAAISGGGGSTVCQPTQITGSITISAPGNFCVGSNITGEIIILSSDVSINLNGYTLNGTILFSSSAIQNITIQNGVIASSSSSGNYAINNSLGASYVTLQNLSILPTANNNGGISNNGDNVVIENCTIVPAAGSPNIGITNSGSNVVISNCTVSGGNALSGSGGDAINLNSATNVIVTQCIIPTTGNATGLGRGGVGIDNIGSSSHIVGCVVKNTGSGAGTAPGTGSGGNGFFISSGATECLIKDCTILNTGNSTGSAGGSSCIVDLGEFTLIEGCTMLSNGVGVGGSTGISESGSTNCIIRNCFVQRATGYGVNVSNCTNLQVSNCTFANLGVQAIAGGTGTGSGNVYYGNFAYNVTGLSGNAYTFPSDAAVDAPNGTAFTSAGTTNRLFNVHKP